MRFLLYLFVYFIIFSFKTPPHFPPSLCTCELGDVGRGQSLGVVAASSQHLGDLGLLEQRFSCWLLQRLWNPAASTRKILLNNIFIFGTNKVTSPALLSPESTACESELGRKQLWSVKVSD